jgi:hypothetical protein
LPPLTAWPLVLQASIEQGLATISDGVACSPNTSDATAAANGSATADVTVEVATLGPEADVVVDTERADVVVSAGEDATVVVVVIGGDAAADLVGDTGDDELGSDVVLVGVGVDDDEDGEVEFVVSFWNLLAHGGSRC